MSTIRYIRDLSAQFLMGCSLKNWFRLLWENRKKPLYYKGIPKFIIITLCIIALTPFRLIDKILFTRRINRIKFTQDPVFILGHWRSGTTYLVNILTQDPSFAVTNAVHCFTPNTFLGSYKFNEWMLNTVLPKQRYLDSVQLDTISSQEEEFAIANMTPFSTYHMAAFQRNWNKYIKYVSFDGIPQKEINEWKDKYLFLLKKVTFQQKGKRLLLKNPVNTARIKYLLEMFPNAKFIHIYRNPYNVYASTRKIYNNFFPIFGLQQDMSLPESQEIQMTVYENMYKTFFEEKELIPEGNLVEIKYEDLIKNPVEIIKQIYDKLNIGNFDKVKSIVEAYTSTFKEYKASKYNLDSETTKRIAKRFGFALKYWGYEEQTQKL